MSEIQAVFHIPHNNLSNYQSIFHRSYMNRYVHAQPEKIIDAGKRIHTLLAG